LDTVFLLAQGVEASAGIRGYFDIRIQYVEIEVISFLVCDHLVVQRSVVLWESDATRTHARVKTPSQRGDDIVSISGSLCYGVRPFRLNMLF
jgi:hypothetical protein